LSQTTCSCTRGWVLATSYRPRLIYAKTWDRVSRFEQRYRTSATSSLLEATRDADQQAAALVRGLRPLPYQCGVLLCLGGQPVQLESYDCPRTLAAVWDALLHAAALDAL